MFGSIIALLSTRVPEQDLCYRRPLARGGTEEGCDWRRLGKLARGDVVLVVSSNRMPGEMALPAGAPLVVDGYDATLIGTDQECARGIGGDSGVSLTISQPSPRGYFVLSACGLAIADLEQMMRQLAASIRIPR
jgi:hypothetical protein